MKFPWLKTRSTGHFGAVPEPPLMEVNYFNAIWLEMIDYRLGFFKY